jgi:ribosome-associated protein
MKTNFKIEGEYIELMALLKALGIASTGGHAKHLIDAEMVIRNGEVEVRRRAKIIIGDVIEIENNVVVFI